MRITRSDATQLVIVDFPWAIPALGFPIAGSMLTLAAIILRSALLRPDFPWFGTGSGDLWGALFSGLLAAAVSAAFTIRCEFAFDLVTRQLTWSRRTLLRKTGGVMPFDQITKAFTEHSTDGDGVTYRVTLRTSAGALPLTPIYSSNEMKFNRICDAINGALDEGRCTLQREGEAQSEPHP